MRLKVLEIFQKIKGDDTLSFLSKGMFISFGAQGLAFIFSTLLHIFLARTAGPENYGIYAYAISWTLIFVMLSKFGFGTAVLKYIASYEAKGKWGLLKGIIIRSHQYSFILNILFGAMSFLILFYLRDHINIKVAEALMISIFLGIFMTHLQVISASLLSLRKILLSKLSTPVLRPVILFLITIGAISFFGSKISGFKIIIFDIYAHIILVFISVIFLLKSLPKKVKVTGAEYNSKKWVQVTIPLFIVTALHLIISQTDIIMLGSITGLKEVGIYNAVIKLCFVISFSLNATTSVIAPMISRLYSLKEYAEIRRMFRFTRILLGSISIPFSIVLFLFSNFFLSFFGEAFVEGNTALKIMILGKLINVIAGPVGFLFTMTGNHITSLKVLSITAIMNIILNFVLIKLMGITGAAIASSVSLIFWNISLILLSKKKFGFRF